MQLTRNITRDADARGSSAGVRHGSRDVRCAGSSVVDGRNGGVTSSARYTVVAEGQVLNEARERHIRRWQQQRVAKLEELRKSVSGQPIEE